MKRVHFGALLWLAAMGACSNAPEGDAESSLVAAPLLAHHERCEDARVPVAHACALSEGPATVLNAGIASNSWLSPDVFSSLRLEAQAGQSRGVVSFRPPSSGEWTFFLGTPNISFSVVRQQPSTAVELVCSRYLSESLVTEVTGSTCRMKGAYVAQLEADVVYRIELGPIAPSSKSVTVIATQNRPLGAQPGAGIACSNAQLSALTSICAGAESTTPVNAGAFGAAAPPNLDLNTAYGVHLATVGAANEGTVQFVAPYTDDYLIALGTPNLDVRVSTFNGEAPARCGNELSVRTKQEIVGSTCAPLRAALRVRVNRGETARIELGRIASVRWVRLAVAPSSADSDGDGVSDGLDLCPADPEPASSEVDVNGWQGGAYDGAWVVDDQFYLNIGQTFVANTSGTLAGISLNVSRGDTTLVHVAVSEFDPVTRRITSAVAAADFDVSAVSGDLLAPTDRLFEFCGGQLVAGRTYLIDVSNLNGSRFYFQANRNSYASGGIWSGNAGLWTSLGADDADFRVWLGATE